MNRPLFIIFFIVFLDAMGIGILFPILPSLLENITHSQNIALYLGILTSIYALMQFVFAPMLGALSDHIGRRPVLLISLAGSAVNYLFLTFSPTLALFIVGRIISGITSANMSVASAYMIDVTDENNRAKYFGLFNAMFGAGFIFGPVLGGILGEYWIRLPFLIAAILTACSFLLAYFILPESRTVKPEQKATYSLNPFKSFQFLFSKKGLIPIVITYFLFSATGEAYGVSWALWSKSTFHWNNFWVGLSLGMYGVCQMLVQAFIPSHASRILGDRVTVFLGLTFTCTALAVLAFAQQGWIVFAILPLLALGSMASPSLQVIASQKVAADQQGQFQGLIASTTGLATMLAPLFFSSIFLHFQNVWTGTIWLSVILVYVVSLPVVFISVQKQLNQPSVS